MTTAEVNTLESETPKHTPMPKASHKEVLTEVESHKNLLQKETIIHEDFKQPTIVHEEERAALILFLTGGFTLWFMR